MNDELHHLLDGELPDEATVDLLRSLIADGEKRSLFREQMKLQGALIRNENFASMSSQEEAEMFGRLSSAIGVKESLPWTKRIGSAAMAMVAGALLLGGGLGFFADRLVSGAGNEPPPASTQPVNQMVPTPSLSTSPPPCNCDSVAAAVRDSLTRAATSVSPTKKAQARTPRRTKIDDPTGSKAAREIAKKKRRTPTQ